MAQARKISTLGEQKQRAILKAAEKEFEKYGYDGARMQRIADKAGMPKSNVHYYFRSKLVLYNAVLEEVVTLWNQAFETLKGTSINCLFPRLRCQSPLFYIHGRILMYSIYIAVLRAGLTSTYVQDALYAGFAGAKTGHKKILVNRGTLNADDDPKQVLTEFAQAEFQIKSVYQKSQLDKKDFDHQQASLTTMVMRICGLE